MATATVDTAKTCANCTNWCPYGAEMVVQHEGEVDLAGRGECRARPPAVDPLSGTTAWPETHAQDWCGGQDPVDASQG